MILHRLGHLLHRATHRRGPGLVARALEAIWRDGYASGFLDASACWLPVVLLLVLIIILLLRTRCRPR